MESNSKKQIVVVTAVIAIAVLIGYLIGYAVTSGEIKQKDAEIYNIPKIVVHIKGAVKNPGLYEFEAGKRIEDAINAAGVLESADLNAINRAAFLIDASEIIIPHKSKGAVSSQININTASVMQLCTLDGIGHETAERIVEYRTLTGGFGRKEELMKITGIGEKTFENIKNKIYVE